MRLLRSFSQSQLLRYAGLFTWACVGLSLAFLPRNPSASAYGVNLLVLAYLAFAVGYIVLTLEMEHANRRSVFLACLVVMSMSALGVGYLTGTGIVAILVLICASVLAWVLPLGLGFTWVLLLNLSMIPIFLQRPGFSLLDALLQDGLYLSLSMLAFTTSYVAQRQTQSREELRVVNSELRATQLLLAEGERAGERLRISRELHDVVGHHLTALSLNLEVASHLVSGKALDHVKQAQSVSKQLLADVRQVVSALRGSDTVDLDRTLRELVASAPAPQIHLHLPEPFKLGDARRAQVLVRLTRKS